VERGKIEKEGSMKYSLDDHHPDSLAIKRLGGRTVAIVVALSSNNMRHIYVNVEEGPLYDDCDDNPERFDQYKKISKWWGDFNKDKEKSVLHLVLLGCVESIGQIQFPLAHWEKWATSLNRILQAQQVRVMTYKDTTPVKLCFVDCNPDDCVVKCCGSWMRIDAITKRHYETIKRNEECFSLLE
jgi:hypothetical protein